MLAEGQFFYIWRKFYFWGTPHLLCRANWKHEKFQNESRIFTWWDVSIRGHRTIFCAKKDSTRNFLRSLSLKSTWKVALQFHLFYLLVHYQWLLIHNDLLHFYHIHASGELLLYQHIPNLPLKEEVFLHLSCRVYGCRLQE